MDKIGECKQEKITYPTKMLAESAKTRQKDIRELREYYCHVCLGYHLTKNLNMSKKKAKNIKEGKVVFTGASLLSVDCHRCGGYGETYGRICLACKGRGKI
jgi:DnaJ-class molecular chaperone